MKSDAFTFLYYKIQHIERYTGGGKDEKVKIKNREIPQKEKIH